jgi:hypothetical protein
VTDEPHGHFGPDCPRCRAMADQAQAQGDLAAALQKMLDDGVFERLGREMAYRREEAFWRAFMAEEPAP